MARQLEDHGSFDDKSPTDSVDFLFESMDTTNASDEDELSPSPLPRQSKSPSNVPLLGPLPSFRDTIPSLSLPPFWESSPRPQGRKSVSVTLRKDNAAGIVLTLPSTIASTQPAATLPPRSIESSLNPMAVAFKYNSCGSNPGHSPHSYYNAVISSNSHQYTYPPNTGANGFYPAGHPLYEDAWPPLPAVDRSSGATTTTTAGSYSSPYPEYPHATASPTSIMAWGGYSMMCSMDNRGEMNPMAKCRQLPCRTFISAGSCPYNDRCVFLHDPRIISSRIIVRTKRKSKEDMCVDAFFWPTMNREDVSGRLDHKNLPHISQHYVVPLPPCPATLPKESMAAIPMTREVRNWIAVYSMYSHYLDFLAADPNSVITVPRLVETQDPCDVLNKHTGKKRLSCFVQLSLGLPIW